MVRFYKRIQDQWFYKECWQDGDRVIFHHGVVGNEGKVDSEPCLDFSAYYNSFKRKYEKQGYSEFSPDHAETIVLKYALKSSEEAESITKSVISLLNERLGWLGLGYVDGYDADVKRSIFRKPKLQVFCIVIDGNLAAKIIPSALENTPFSICDVSVTKKEH